MADSKRGVSWAVALAALCAMTAPARADFAVQDLRVNVFLGPGFNQIFGWEFTANTTLTVTKLGWYDHGFDGLATNHQVGIFDALTQQLLVSTTIGPGNAGPIEGPPVRSALSFPDPGGFRYVDVPLTTLDAGGRYIIAGTSPPGEMDVTAVFSPAGGPNSLATDPGLTFVQGRSRQGGSVLVFPTDVPPLGNTGFGPTFQFAPAIPEPSALALLGLGALGLAGYGWRRRKQ